MHLNTRACKAALLAIASSFSVGMPSAQAPSAHRVMLDEAHHNIMATASGGYRPLVQVLTDAGFNVTPNTLPFRPDRLATTDVVCRRQSERRRRAGPAWQNVPHRRSPMLKSMPLKQWVKGGGGLLLVTDHYPTGVAARSLAERFGVKLSGGWTDDPANRWPLPGMAPYSDISCSHSKTVCYPTIPSRADPTNGKRSKASRRSAEDRCRARPEAPHCCC
jgi:hypothetical protein